MINRPLSLRQVLLAGLVSTAACSTDPNTTAIDAVDTPTEDVATVTGELPADLDYEAALLAAGWSTGLQVGSDGDTITFGEAGLPDHDVLDLYSVPDGSTLRMDDTIVGGSIAITLSPTLAETPTETGLGAIGIAVSGGWFFNPYEGDGSTLALESNFEVDGVPFIDSCNGHPLPTDRQYHYHGIPYCITDVIDTAGQHSVLLGLIRDGFPIYGPLGADGTVPTDLDGCNGHVEATPEFPDGLYHYHVTEAAPYVPVCFAGVAEGGGSGPPGGGPPGGGPGGGPP